MTLTDFLLAQIAKDEAEARLLDEHYRRHELTDTDLSVTDDGPALRISPARVLAECETKRRIVAEVSTWLTQRPAELAGAFPALEQMMTRPLLHLAAVYADHPDYNEGWKP